MKNYINLFDQVGYGENNNIVKLRIKSNAANVTTVLGNLKIENQNDIRNGNTYLLPTGNKNFEFDLLPNEIMSFDALSSYDFFPIQINGINVTIIQKDFNNI